MATSKYEIDSVVYLADAASVGRLESYKVSSIRLDPSGTWYYRISFPQRPPTVLQSTGDRVTNKIEYDVDFSEDMLCSVCEAITLAESYFNTQLAKIQALKSELCGGSSTGT